MSKTNFLSFLGSTLLFFTFFYGPLSQAEMGFYNPKDQKIKEVSDSHQSIFNIAFPCGNYDVFMPESYEEAFQNYNRQNKLLKAGFVEFCLGNELPICLVFDDVSIGTGFVAEKSNWIWTARHLLEAYTYALNEEWKNHFPSSPDGWREYPIPMKVFPYDDIYVMKEVGIRKVKFLSVVTPPENPHNLSSSGAIDYLSSDWAVIETELDVAPPLELARQKVTDGEVYLYGFAEKTVNRLQDYQAPDANGINMVFSFGPILSLDESLQRLSVLNSMIGNTIENLNSDAALKQRWDNEVFWGQIDAEFGNSGGPLLNKEGKVIGIISSRIREYRGSVPSLTFSYGLRSSFLLDQIKNK